MKSIVTGGAGFIGSNVVDQLVKLNHEVVVVDDFSTGKQENINPKATVYQVDIADNIAPELVPENLSGIFGNADYIFHLAALPRVEPSIVDPIESHRINVDGTFNVFWAARLAGVKNIVFSSSSSVYGDAKTQPITEQEPLAPMSPYALQKLVNEQYAKLFCELYDMNITCLRYFNVYGHREPTEGSYVPVVGIWLRQLAAQEPLTITGDGEQSRDFVNVFDVSNANIACMNAELKGFDVFNVGSGQSYELNYLASLISDDKKYIEPRIEPRYTKSDISKLMAKTNWKPEVSIKDYLVELVDKTKRAKNES
jgi:UDP-glucose 4-epimerase